MPAPSLGDGAGEGENSMSVTIRDILTLPSMRGARVVGGQNGLDREVRYVTVQDFFNLDPIAEEIFQSIPFIEGELVITSMTDISQDTEAQCRALHSQKALGDVGMILYYVGLVVPDISPRLAETADALDFPLICMPERDAGLRYSDAIREIMETVIRDENRAHFFLPELLRMLISQPEDQRSMEGFFRMAGGYLDVGLLLADSRWNLLEGFLQDRDLSQQIQPLLRKVSESISEGRIDSEAGILHFAVGTVPQRGGGDLNLVVLDRKGAVSSNLLSQLVEAAQTALGLNREVYTDNDQSSLVGAVLQGNRRSAQRLAQRMHRDLDEFNTLAVVAPLNRQVLSKPQALLKRVREEISYRYPGCFAELYRGAVIVLGDANLGRSAVRDWLPVYIGMKEDDIDTCLYVCSFLRGVEEFRDAYQLILRQRDNASHLYPNWHVLTLYHFQIAETCQKLVENNGAAERLRILEPLNEIEEPLRSELRKTLRVYQLDAYQSVSRTAELMYLHRNTIKYRIKRISDCLGFDVSEMPELAHCYLACALERYLSSIELSKWTNNAYHNCF